MSTYANLHPKYIFGLNQSCKSGNVYFVENNQIIYPAGNTVIILSLDSKTQTFLHGTEKYRGVNCLTVSYNRMYAAIGQIAEKPEITIFDLKMVKKRKTLQATESTVKEFVSLAFTTDNLHLGALTGGPDYTFMLWKWDRSRLVTTIKATGSQGPVYQISSSPNDSNVLLAVGNATFRFFRLHESHLKSFGYQRGDSQNFLCHAWYKNDRVIAGTAAGTLMLFERGEYRQDIQIKNVKNEITGILSERGRKTNKVAATTSTREGLNAQTVSQVFPAQKGTKNNPFERSVSNFTGTEVTAIASYSKGFVVGYGVGNVIVFEEQATYQSQDEHYKQLYVVMIPHDSSESEDRIIDTLAVSPNDETIIATCFNCNVYSFNLSTAEIKEAEEMYFELANASYHFGAILGLDCAIRKSLVVTCGVDKFIRVWNFLTMTQEAAREFAEDIYCVSVHPTGLFVLAGCVDKIRMYTVLINDIRELKEWPIRMCKELRFSNGGHYFAVANGNVLQLYSTTTLENISNMKGHSSKIRKIVWTLDDFHIVTAGADGAIYEWDIQTGKRTADIVERGHQLVSVVVTPDNKTHFAVNANRYIKEIQIYEAMVLKELELGLMPTCIALSRSGKVLLAGFDDGTVRAFRQPLTYSGEWSDYHMHNAAITGLLCTYDEIFCVSVAADNSICFWKMTDAEGRLAKLEKDLNYSTEILVTKQDLEERQVQINELKQRYGELKLEMDYALKRKDMMYKEEIKELNSRFTSEVATLSEQIKDISAAKESNANEYNNYVKDLIAKHQAQVESTEAHFNKKLISEYEKYNALQNLLENTIKEYEDRLVNLESDRTTSIEELIDYFEGKIKDKNSALEQAFNDAQMQMAESDEMKKQIEEDADQEILEMTTNYERKLRHEREMNAKLKGESGIMRKKFQTIQKDIEEQKNEVQRLMTECAKYNNLIKMSEKDVVTLQKALVDKDLAVANKDKHVTELMKTNADLEKFKFVLEYRIRELRKLMEPKDREIIYLKQQNADMETELESTIFVRNGLQLQVSELKNKLRMTDQERNKERMMRMRSMILVERMRSYLTRAMSVLADHKSLKWVVKTMYAKYGNPSKSDKAGTAEQEAICELVRQRSHLEISLTAVKRKLAKDAEFTRQEQLKVMHENMLLIYEINSLRRELKVARDRLNQYETSLGLNQTSHGDTAEMRFKLQAAIEDRDDLDIAHENDLELREDMIRAQQEEIDSLSTKILKVNEYIHDTTKLGGMGGGPAIDHIKSVLSTGQVLNEAEESKKGEEGLQHQPSFAASHKQSVGPAHGSSHSPQHGSSHMPRESSSQVPAQESSVAWTQASKTPSQSQSQTQMHSQSQMPSNMPSSYSNQNE